MATAATKLMTELEKEQETLIMLADMCIDTYAIDSADSTAIQAQKEASEKDAKLHAAMAQVAAHEIYERAISRARRIVIELFPDKDQYAHGLWSSTDSELHETLPLMPLRRENRRSQAIEADGYPLDLLSPLPFF